MKKFRRIGASASVLALVVIIAASEACNKSPAAPSTAGPTPEVGLTLFHLSGATKTSAGMCASLFPLTER